MDKQNNRKLYKATILNGVCYLNFYEELTIENVFAAQDEAIGLLNEAKINIVPLVLVFNDIDDGNMKIGINDFGKMGLHNNFVQRVSGIWVVGAEGLNRQSSDVINERFHEGKMHIVEKLEEAKTEAEKLSTNDTPLLEQQ